MKTIWLKERKSGWQEENLVDRKKTQQKRRKILQVGSKFGRQRENLVDRNKNWQIEKMVGQKKV